MLEIYSQGFNFLSLMEAEKTSVFLLVAQSYGQLDGMNDIQHELYSNFATKNYIFFCKNVWLLKSEFLKMFV